MIEAHLQFLGLKKEEIKIYLELLQRGQISVTAIAKFTKIARINCYHHLLNLKKRGFVIESKKNKMKHFSAENPQIFLAKAKEQQNIAQEILPELIAMTNTNSAKPKIQFFEDKQGIKKIFTNINQQNVSEIFSFTNFEKLSEIIPITEIQKILKERIKQNIKSRFICAWNTTADKLNQEIFSKNTDFFEVFFITPEKFPLKSEVTILKNTVITLNLNAQTPMGTVLIDEEVFKAQKAIFNLAWMAATSFIGE